MSEEPSKGPKGKAKGKKCEKPCLGCKKTIIVERALLRNSFIPYSKLASAISSTFMANPRGRQALLRYWCYHSSLHLSQESRIDLLDSMRGNRHEARIAGENTTPR